MAYRDEGSIQQFYESLVRRLDQVEAAVREVAQDSGVDISVIEALLADVDFSEFVSLSHDDLSDVTAVNHHVRYSDAEAIAAVGPVASLPVDHTNAAEVTNTGSNTHAQIDTHISTEPAASIAVHTGISAAHHARYTDAEAISAVSVVTDHGALTGLADDDHPQYTTEAEVIAIVTPTYFLCDSVTATAGTIGAGDHTTVHDRDATYLRVDEAGGAPPGIDVAFDWSGLTNFNKVMFHGYYTGTHTVTLQLYNYNTAAWEDLFTITPGGTTPEALTADVADDTDYIDAGAAQLRFYHPDNGNPSHDLFVDWLVFSQAFGVSGGSIDHGELAGLADDDHPQYLKDKANGGAASEIPEHTHADASEAGTVSHDDLTDVATDDHHTRYADAEAVSAMGVEGDANPLNHARYTDAEAVTAVGAHLDPAAIHDDTAGEIHAVTAKATPVDADEILIEDSAASWAKKRIALTDLLAGGGVTDHGALSGLTPDDDHPQYLLVDGTRAMTGNLDMDSNDINNLGVIRDVAGDVRVDMISGSYQIRDDAGTSRLALAVSATGDFYLVRNASGTDELWWQEAEDRMNFTHRPYSSADSALLEVVGHAHSTLSGVGADDHHAKYTDAEAATQADTQIAAAAVGDLSDVTEWAAWSPSYGNLTVGNGTVVARYREIGGTVELHYTLTLGSASSVGSFPYLSLPVEASAQYVGGRNAVGTAYYLDSGTADRWGLTRIRSATTIQTVAAGSAGVLNAITATVPFTWAEGDILSFSARYEAA